MTPKQFNILKKTTYTVLALSLGVSVFWLSSGGSMFQASLVEEQGSAEQLAQTYNEVENTNQNELHAAAEESSSATFGGDQFGSGGATGLSVNRNTEATLEPASRSTISNEMATYRQTMTDSVTTAVENTRTPLTEEAQATETAVETPTPNTVPTTGPSEVLFFLLSMGGAFACYLWYKKSEQGA